MFYIKKNKLSTVASLSWSRVVLMLSSVALGASVKGILLRLSSSWFSWRFSIECSLELWLVVTNQDFKYTFKTMPCWKYHTSLQMIRLPCAVQTKIKSIIWAIFSCVLRQFEEKNLSNLESLLKGTKHQALYSFLYFS